MNSVLHIVDGQNEYVFNAQALHEIVFIKADGNYVDIYLDMIVYRSVRIQIGQLWKKIQELKVPHNLVRIDRSRIVNLDKKHLEHINPKKQTIILRIGGKKTNLKVAKVAFGRLKNIFEQLLKDSSEDILIVDRPRWQSESDKKDMCSGHAYVDLGLPSGTLWAAEDMSVADSDFDMYRMRLYDSPLFSGKDPYVSDEDELDEGLWADLISSDIQKAADWACVKWGKNWRIPTKDEWEELLLECTPRWQLNKHGNVVCVLKGKNGNEIVLTSISPYRGLCTYWTCTRNDKNHEQASQFFSIEIHEPYENETWYHFIYDFNQPECNLHAVIVQDIDKGDDERLSADLEHVS